MTVQFTIRDIHGATTVVNTPFAEAGAWLEANLTEEDELLVIKIDNQIIWTGLTGDRLTLDELTGFFA